MAWRLDCGAVAMILQSRSWARPAGSVTKDSHPQRYLLTSPGKVQPVTSWSWGSHRPQPTTELGHALHLDDRFAQWCGSIPAQRGDHEVSGRNGRPVAWVVRDAAPSKSDARKARPARLSFHQAVGRLDESGKGPIAMNFFQITRPPLRPAASRRGRSIPRPPAFPGGRTPSVQKNAC